MISLIITVLNEKESLPEWLASIYRQTKQPDEIVIVDGGSTDGTWEWLESIASPTIKAKQAVGNIAHGRNLAITMASGDTIAVTDAGCVYANDWFERLVTPILAKQAVFAATAFGPWLKPTDSFLTYVIAAVTIPAPFEFAKNRWLASSRSVAFSRGVWDTVGGYPEWIPVCEDVIFDLKIKEKGLKEASVNEPLVSWRPRVNFISFFRQLYRYTKGDGHGKLFLGRQLIRYLVYIVALCLAIHVTSLSLGLLAIGIIIYSMKFWRRFWQFTPQKNLFYRLAGIIVTPIMLALGDVAKMCGWPVGVFERWTGKMHYQEL